MKTTFMWNVWAVSKTLVVAAFIVQLSATILLAQQPDVDAVRKPGFDVGVLPKSGLDSITAPSNDNFADAIALSSYSSGGALRTNVGATAEAGEPFHGGGKGGSVASQNNSVWYKHTPLVNGTLTVYTQSSSPADLTDTVISVYTGSSVNALTPVAECDDTPGYQYHCRITITALVGQTYYIAVDGYGALTGNFWFGYSAYDYPPNDNFANAQALGNSPGSPFMGISGSNYGGTSETGEPTHAPTGAGSNNSIWYTWTPSISRTTTFTTAGSNFDTVLAVYAGSAVNGLGLVARNDDFGPSGTFTSQVSFYATAGVTYKIAVDGYISAVGNVLLTWKYYTDEDGKRFDFDGDERSDLSIYRPSNGQWWISRSSSGVVATTFGTSEDRPTPADFTGDGKVDIAFWRPSTGTWYILRSEDSSFYSLPFGTTGDIPVTGLFDNDKSADVAVFRPSNSTWYIRQSRSGSALIQQFGTSGDLPVPADYDGDGRTDVAIYRPSNGQWWLNRTTAGTIAVTFGTSTDKPVVGDYTGDGRPDISFWRPSTGEWFTLRSEDFSYYSLPFGTSTDIPAPGDFDGDRTFDQAVFRPSDGNWYINRSGGGGPLIRPFGTAGDRPTQNSYIP